MPTPTEVVAEKKAKVYDAAMKELETAPLSKALRGGTWPDHESVRFGPFEVALAKGTIREDAYRDYMAQSWYIYSAIEERAEQLKDDALAGQFVMEELNRKTAIEKDLAFFYGDDWAGQIEQLEVVTEYVERISNANPLQFIAHHYTRYMADLSGGRVIYGALKQAWDRGDDGLQFYLFPGIAAMPFKDSYRATLDELSISNDQKWEIIEESLLAYEYNKQLTDELTIRYSVPAPA